MLTNLLDQARAGSIATTAAQDEGDWHALWHDRALATLPPPAMAFHGGLLADRLPWVFVAGYQAVLHRVFPRLEELGAAYWVVVPLFVVAMTAFLWPAIGYSSSWLVLGIMGLLAVGMGTLFYWRGWFR